MPLIEDKPNTIQFTGEQAHNEAALSFLNPRLKYMGCEIHGDKKDQYKIVNNELWVRFENDQLFE